MGVTIFFVFTITLHSYSQVFHSRFDGFEVILRGKNYSFFFGQKVILRSAKKVIKHPEWLNYYFKNKYLFLEAIVS